MNPTYLAAGTWGFGEKNTKGFHLFRYDPSSGDLFWLSQTDPFVSAGHIVYEPRRSILYVVDEVESREGETGGGGFVRAYRLNPENGQISFLNERNVLMPKPAYLALDPSGEYLLAACHSSRAAVTKVVYDAKGGYSAAVLYDDAGIVLLRLEADGSLGEIADVQLQEGLTKAKGQVHAHPHSVLGSPDGRIYFSCDKGVDKIFAYALDRERGKLRRLLVTDMPFATAPRYSAFHPTLPVWYENNETDPGFYAFQYDPETGLLKQLSHFNLYEPGEKASQSDIAVSPDGKFVFAAVRYTNEIYRFAADETGALTLLGKTQDPGTPRGLAVSPDGYHLYAANNEEANLFAWRIAPSGDLSPLGVKAEIKCAATLRFLA